MLKINNLHIKFQDFALSNINLSVNKGEYFMLLGESGAGKSVILECIAGLVRQAQGEIILKNNDISRSNIQKRKVGLVFQDFALFPHLTVKENIIYPLKIRKVKKEIVANKLKQLACDLNIDNLLSRSITTLSGGEKQRVALARTLTLEPDVLLLDEPLSSIDVSLKGELRTILRRLNQNGQTIVHVTHDYEEAISLAHRIAIVHNGEIIQVGTPAEVFQHPKNKFVAHFGGIKNFYAAKLELQADKETTKACITERIAFEILTKHKAKNGHVLIGQKNILLSAEPTTNNSQNNFKGIIQEIIPARFGFELVVDTGIIFYVAVTSEAYSSHKYKQEQEIWLSFNPSLVRFIPG